MNAQKKLSRWLIVLVVSTFQLTSTTGFHFKNCSLSLVRHIGQLISRSSSSFTHSNTQMNKHLTQNLWLQSVSTSFFIISKQMQHSLSSIVLKDKSFSFSILNYSPGLELLPLRETETVWWRSAPLSAYKGHSLVEAETLLQVSEKRKFYLQRIHLPAHYRWQL